MSVAPFLVKTFDLVTDTENDAIVSWTPDGTSFVVWNPPEFSKQLLPKHFKHNNFSSFVRQLNTYGFKKIDPDRWEFANGNFQRDRPELMSSIQRRKGQSKEQQPSNALIASGQNVIEVGQYGGLMEEVEGLKRDKNVLMMELVHLRQQQQKSDTHVSAMKKRLEHTEKRLSELISFFSRVASNPAVLAQMVTAAQQSQAYLAGAEARRKKRKPDGDTGDTENANAQLIPYKPIDVATFFQNLMVSPLPEPPEVHPDGVADALEAQFNSIDLAEAKATAQPDGFTIQEHCSSAEAGGDDSNGEEGDPDIQVPPELAGAIPSIGVAPSTDAPTASVGVPGAAISSGNTEQPGVFDLAQLPATGTSNGTGPVSPGLFSGSIPLPDAAGMSLDEMDVPAELLLDPTMGDIFKGGSSLGELPEFKDESWNPIMDEDFGVPPPMSS